MAREHTTDAIGGIQNSKSAEFLRLEIVREPEQPVIKPGDPGTDGIEQGLEGGTVIKQDGIHQRQPVRRFGEGQRPPASST